MIVSTDQLEAMLEAALAAGPAAAMGTIAPEERPRVFAEILALAVVGAECRLAAADNHRGRVGNAVEWADRRLKRFA